MQRYSIVVETASIVARGAANPDGTYYLAHEADARIAELEKDNADLRTVMIAAAEEILQHWQAHCDAEGYGPENLVRRLEMGIPSEYGYTAGAFEKLRLRNAELVKALESLMTYEPEHCPCGHEECTEVADSWKAAREALKGDAT